MGNKTKKEVYMDARNRGLTNGEIANIFGVSLTTVNRSIGSNSKVSKKELMEMALNKRITEERAENSKNLYKEEVFDDEEDGEEEDEEEEEEDEEDDSCYSNSWLYEGGKEAEDYDTRYTGSEFNGEELRPIRRYCKDCGKEFLITVSEQEYFSKRGLLSPMRCFSCRRIKKERRSNVCADCGEKFYISESRENFFLSNGLAIPKRCDSCLKNKREIKKLKGIE